MYVKYFSTDVLAVTSTVKPVLKSVIKLWSFKTCGLSWQWSLKRGSTVSL